MARLHLILLFSAAVAAVLSAPSAAAVDRPHAFLQTVIKDPSTSLYFSTIDIGTNITVSPSLVIDLASPFTWYDCFSGYASSSYRPIQFGSSKCKLAKSTSLREVPKPDWVDCSAEEHVKPGCSNHSCGVFPYNPVENRQLIGTLSQDIMGFYSTPDGLSFGSRFNTPPIIFSCVGRKTADGFPEEAQGLLSLSKNELSLPMQLTSAFKLPRKFALCLPSTPEKLGFGDLFIGGGPYILPLYPGDASELFTITPLITNPVRTAMTHVNGEPSDEYFINVTSIEIDGKTLPFETSLLSIDSIGDGGTKLSTVVPYTVLHTSIYKHFIKDFKTKAASKKMVQVAAVAPFDACFSSESVKMGIAGPDVPVIDLVLQSGGVWRIYGSNSMVAMNDDATCLAFLDGGSKPGTAILIGGYQLEDNLVEFDIESSKLAFTSSLLLHKASCSHHRAPKSSIVHWFPESRDVTCFEPCDKLEADADDSRY